MNKFNRGIHTIECLLHINELLFKNYFFQTEGPSKSPKTLSKNAVHSLIGKISVVGDRTINSIAVPSNIREELTKYLHIHFNNSSSTDLNKIRDDQICLLVWSAKVAGIEIPDKLVSLWLPIEIR